MKKIVPFKKEVKFNDDVSEITSISLEHTLQKSENNLITGSFIITGDYKVNVTTTIIEKFNFEIPFDINIDDKYDISDATIEIDDFYYEIINDKLMINIDILLDKLNEIIPIKKEIYNIEKEIYNIEKETKNEDVFDRCIEEDTVEPIIQIEENNGYSVYKVYIVKEEDTLNTILDKYNISVEDLEHYNDLTNIQKGMKIIIPSL